MSNMNEPVGFSMNDVNAISSPPEMESSIHAHIVCKCSVCNPGQGSPYGSYHWYKKHCADLARLEWEAHENKRSDYCGPSSNVFWMTDDIQKETGLDFEDIWLAWASRHWRGLVRALKVRNYKQAGKRALDLMGWLFLLLAKYKSRNSK